ncbi:hypothetical protein AMTRI_Chr09g15390 [Amborella trichopoda]
MLQWAWAYTLAAAMAMLPASTGLGFSCKSPSSTTCQAFVGYFPQNTTTAHNITALFSLYSASSLFAANSLPASTPSSHSFPSGRPVRVPIICRCANGIGISDGTPNYTVVKDDTLSLISETLFSGLLTFPDIAQVNNISDPNRILVGQKLWIPLPCSCDEVEERRVAHYAHVVVAGSTTDEIVARFGVKKSVLLSLNNITDSSLKAGAVLDVPLPACYATMDDRSMDRNLIVPNGSYALTANDCVECLCNSTDLRLQCKPFQVTNICPSMSCEVSGLANDLPLGNTLSSSANSTSTACPSATCAYQGYTNATIFTKLDTSTCSGGPPSFGSIARVVARWWGLLFLTTLFLLS